MRVALFGGTFDPVHRGHLAIARAAADALGLDRVLFAPTGRQPLKLNGTRTSFADRVAMVGLACAVDSRFEVSEVDGPREDGRPNYTVDTLEALRQERPGDVLYVLVGADSFLEVPRWHRSAELLEMAEWIVVSRPGFSLGNLSGLELTAGRPAEQAAEQGGRVHVIAGVAEEVSATALRERLRAGEDCAALVPAAVMDYVRRHDLYRTSQAVL